MAEWLKFKRGQCVILHNCFYFFLSKPESEPMVCEPETNSQLPTGLNWMHSLQYETLQYIGRQQSYKSGGIDLLKWVNDQNCCERISLPIGQNWLNSHHEGSGLVTHCHVSVHVYVCVCVCLYMCVCAFVRACVRGRKCRGLRWSNEYTWNKEETIITLIPNHNISKQSLRTWFHLVKTRTLTHLFYTFSQLKKPSLMYLILHFTSPSSLGLPALRPHPPIQ